MKVDLLYLCHGRVEFTRKTLATLLENTNWDRVHQFVVYNDSAPDGSVTTDLLNEMLPEGAQYRATNLRSPVGVMNHFLYRGQSDVFAKIDNDIMVPPGWLDAMCSVMEADANLQLLGMEAGFSARRPSEDDDCWTWTPARNIGGVGLMRRDVFERCGYPKPDGRFGFTEWQHRFRPQLGWIEPDLRVFSLDKVPMQPWKGLKQKYLDRDVGLQRDWQPHPRTMRFYWDWADLKGTT